MSSSARGDRLACTGSQRASQRLERTRLDEHALGVRLLGAGVRGVGGLVPREQDPGARVAEVERHLALLEQRVHRHDHRAGAQRAVVATREVRDVGEHDADAVAGLDALGLQQAGDAGDGVVELVVGELDGRRA